MVLNDVPIMSAPVYLRIFHFLMALVYLTPYLIGVMTDHQVPRSVKYQQRLMSAAPMIVQQKELDSPLSLDLDNGIIVAIDFDERMTIHWVQGLETVDPNTLAQILSEEQEPLKKDRSIQGQQMSKHPPMDLDQKIIVDIDATSPAKRANEVLPSIFHIPDSPPPRMIV